MNFIRKLVYYFMSVPNWIGHNIHNSYGIINVFDIMWFRPYKGGLLSSDHGFVTGNDPTDGKPIWTKNIVYQSTRKRHFNETDEILVKKIMKFLARMVESSASSELYPNGKKNRMPPAVNYIHGTVHFNGLSLIFDDFKDAREHFSDPKFYRDFLYMTMKEKREPTIVFRDKDYDPDEFAIFSCFMKTRFPFFGNPNGNKKRLHWGTPSPSPAFNLILGWWIKPTKKLRYKSNHDSLLRPAVSQGIYMLAKDYGSRGKREYMLPEKIWAKITYFRIKLRGKRGGMYFSDKRKVDSGFLYDPNELITLKERLVEKVSGVRA